MKPARIRGVLLMISGAFFIAGLRWSQAIIWSNPDMTGPRLWLTCPVELGASTMIVVGAIAMAAWAVALTREEAK